MARVAPVIAHVVENDMCIGCGVCTAVCPQESLRMQWNPEGFLVAAQVGECDEHGLCIQVCPFNPNPEAEVRTEDELSRHFLTDAMSHDANVGNYHKFYAGYSREYRATSSSGGLATYLTTKLLERGVVQGVISVRPSQQGGEHFEYGIVRSGDAARAAARTRYYPVTLERVLKLVREQEGPVAFIGIACFVKAIRLAQKVDPAFNAKVRFVIGIICGGVKSKSFTEYLSGLQGTGPTDIVEPDYRVKDLARPASDYSFSHGSVRTGRRQEIRMRLVGDMWGTGLFKANACDFCDDVTTELADISLGDAWLDPYVADGQGTSVLVVRSQMAREIIQDGIQSHELFLDHLSLESFKRSQQGSFNHRQSALPFRLTMMKWQGRRIPPKRFEAGWIHLDFKVVQLLRRLVRARSLAMWRKEPIAETFNRRMALLLRLLRFATKANGRMKGLRRRLKRGVIK